MARNLTTTFDRDARDIYPCPSCPDGRLSVVSETFHEEEVASSRNGRANHADEWEPDFWRGRFVGLLACNKSYCGETVAIAGDVTLDEVFDEEDHNLSKHEHRYQPTFISPAPPIFPVPRDCPAPIVLELERAFAAFWLDLSGCANRVRCAVEALLTSQRVKRFGKNDKGKRCPIFLDARIREWRKQPGREHLADALLAVKWIGNAGSHAGDPALKRSDLFDGFDLLKHVLDKLFVTDSHEREVQRIARGINKHRKPRSKHPS